ncbi:hypothetical protein Salat_1674200, partial [Sesamum alatum]
AALSLTEEEESGLVVPTRFWHTEPKSQGYYVGYCSLFVAYDKNLLILAPVDPADNPSLVDLTFSDFYVHIHGLSLGKMTKEVCEFIGSRLGKFRGADLDAEGVTWGSYVRIRVGIDVYKPLQGALKLRIVLGNEQLITFTYERLPSFCYFCGCLGRLYRQCELQFNDDFSDPEEYTPFGPWLRAVLPAFSRQRMAAS